MLDASDVFLHLPKLFRSQDFVTKLSIVRISATSAYVNRVNDWIFALKLNGVKLLYLLKEPEQICANFSDNMNENKRVLCTRKDMNSNSIPIGSVCNGR